MVENLKPTSSPKSPKTKWLLPLLLGFVLATILASMLFFSQKNNKPKVETVTREGVISKIQTLNRLQTVAYSVDTVIKAEKQGTWQQLWQDEQKGLFVAHGRVQAGVDLNLLKPENVQIENIAMNEGDTHNKITITLPPAQVFETYLDNVEVYDIKTGLFGAMPTDPAIFNEAQTAGKQQVLATACKSDMLKLATENAQKQVQSLFALANVNVTVNVVPPKNCG